MNPLINAGAIAACGQVLPSGGMSRFQRILRHLSRCAGRSLEVDQDVYRSESDTGHRNRAIGWMLRNFGILDEDPLDALETYFQQCSIRVTCRDLALMGATLANQGKHPLTSEQAIAPDTVDNILSVMATCGMYDYSGEWLYRVGLPAKSGVGGGILAVLPGQLGIGVFSPLLDAQGNSVRGVRACVDLAQELGVHLFNPAAAPRPALRQTFSAAQVSSRRRRPPPIAAALRTYGGRIRVFQLEGHLTFGTTEPVLRALLRHAPYAEHLLLDLALCSGADKVSLRQISTLRERLAAEERPVRLGLAGLGKLERELREGGFPAEAIFSDIDQALENAENDLLQRLPGGTAAPTVSLRLLDCVIFQRCPQADIAWLEERLPTRLFQTGESITVAGAPADAFFIITRGSVEVRLPSQQHSEARRLDAFTAGMTFGEMGFLDQGPRSADTVAIEPVECRIFPRSLYEELDEVRPLLKIALLTELTRLISSHLRRTNAELAALRN